MRGETAKMAAIKRLSDQPYRVETEMVDVTKVANFEKKVPWTGSPGRDARQREVRALRPPAYQAELSPIYINGVPPAYSSVICKNKREHRVKMRRSVFCC